MFHDTAAELHLATTQLSHPIYAFPPYLPPADLHLFREIACDLLYKCNSLAQFIAQDASMRVDYIIYFLSFSTDPHNYLSGSQLTPETLEKTYGVFIIVLLCMQASIAHIRILIRFAHMHQVFQASALTITIIYFSLEW
jgi:hypothetical protein